MSSLDRVSNGRFLFGVGNGWNRDEIENHGTVFKTRHKLGRERIEAMKRIWTEDEPEYHGELVNIEKMSQWPKPVQKPHPPIIVGGAIPYAARRAIAYGDGWIPRADRLAKDGVRVQIDQFREMAKEAGRDLASLPITIFRVPEDIAGLRFAEEIGVDRVTFSLPAGGRDQCTVAQGEAEIKPYRVLNDLDRKAMAPIRKLSHGSWYLLRRARSIPIPVTRPWGQVGLSHAQI